MNFLEQIHHTFARTIRPITRIRGTYRLFRPINRAFLGLGVPPIRVAKMRDGTSMRIDLRSITEWWAFYSGSYDDAALGFIEDLLSRIGGDFLDVGGNIGMYAVRVAARLDPEQRAICFEPMPDNAERIRQNAELNSVSEQVDVHEIALSNEQGKATLVLREDFEQGSMTGNASIAISSEADQNFKRIEVETCRFDDLRRRDGLQELPVAKVDIEGHEDFFLSGAREYLRGERPIIITEINNWYYEQRGTTSSEVFSATIPDDYEAALFRSSGLKPTLSACRISELASLRRLETCVFFPPERKPVLDLAIA